MIGRIGDGPTWKRRDPRSCGSKLTIVQCGESWGLENMPRLVYSKWHSDRRGTPGSEADRQKDPGIRSFDSGALHCACSPGRQGLHHCVAGALTRMAWTSAGVSCQEIFAQQSCSRFRLCGDKNSIIEVVSCELHLQKEQSVPFCLLGLREPVVN